MTTKCLLEQDGLNREVLKAMLEVGMAGIRQSSRQPLFVWPVTRAHL